MNKHLKWLLPIALFLWCVVIFHFSLDDAAASGADSGSVTAWLNGILSRVRAPWQLSGHTVRKTAHFTEFFILGVLALGTAFAFLRRFRPAAAWGFCVAVAVVDECLQFLSPGRAPAVPDVLLDSAGAAAGLLLLWLLLYLIERKRKIAKNT